MGSREPIIARASRRVAVLIGGDDALLEALFLVALDRGARAGRIAASPAALGALRGREGREAEWQFIANKCTLYRESAG